MVEPALFVPDVAAWLDSRRAGRTPLPKQQHPCAAEKILLVADAGKSLSTNAKSDRAVVQLRLQGLRAATEMSPERARHLHVLRFSVRRGGRRLLSSERPSARRPAV